MDVMSHDYISINQIRLIMTSKQFMSKVRRALKFKVHQQQLSSLLLSQGNNMISTYELEDVAFNMTFDLTKYKIIA